MVLQSRMSGMHYANSCFTWIKIFSYKLKYWILIDILYFDARWLPGRSILSIALAENNENKTAKKFQRKKKEFHPRQGEDREEKDEKRKLYFLIVIGKNRECVKCKRG